MKLKIFLPSAIFIQEEGVTSIVTDTEDGSFGILPHRLDCVAALTTGILIYETGAGNEHFVAIDEGILIKTGDVVMVSVRRAHKGNDLALMKKELEKEFLKLDEKEESTRSVLQKMESAFVHRLSEFKHG